MDPNPDDPSELYGGETYNSRPGRVGILSAYHKIIDRIAAPPAYKNARIAHDAALDAVVAKRWKLCRELMDAHCKSAPEPEDADFGDDLEYAILAASRDEASKHFRGIRQAALDLLLDALRSENLTACYYHPREDDGKWGEERCTEPQAWRGPLGEQKLPGLTHNYLPPDLFADGRQLPEVEWKNGKFFPPLQLHVNRAAFETWLAGVQLCSTANEIGLVERHSHPIAAPSRLLKKALERL